jgi:drug/metabolite transporter (DMT)-like permease
MKTVSQYVGLVASLAGGACLVGVFVVNDRVARGRDGDLGAGMLAVLLLVLAVVCAIIAAVAWVMRAPHSRPRSQGFEVLPKPPADK